MIDDLNATNATTGSRWEISGRASNVQCHSSTQTVERNHVSSTYVASYTQIVNPDYVTTQRKLTDAEQQLREIQASANASSNNAVSAALNGIAIGLALKNVNGLRSQLNVLQPYLSEPVLLQYSATRVTVRKTAAARAEVELDTGDRLFAEGEASEIGFAMENVLPSDGQGLTNSQAELPTDDALQVRALAALTKDLGRQIRTTTSRYCLRLAAREKTALGQFGFLLLARDFDADEAVAVAGKELEQLAARPVPALRTMKPLSLSVPEETAAKPAASSIASSYIQSAMAATVSVLTDSKQGSGFFVRPDGYIVTNAHVVTDDPQPIVKTADGKKHMAQVVAISPSIDLALLKVTDEHSQTALRMESEPPEVGGAVIVVGAPLGLEHTVTKGIVSSTRASDGVEYVQIDAAINPGNSGGPVVNEAGKAIGVATMRMQGESLGFAIAASEAAKFLRANLPSKRSDR